MALSNSQYDMIMAEYAARRSRAAEQLEHRRAHAAKLIPELADMEAAYADAGIMLAKAMIMEDSATADTCRCQLEEIAEGKAVLLSAAGLPEDYLSLHYECDKCRDTGYIDGQKCECFRRRQTELLYDASNIKELLAVENFGTFTFDYYDRYERDALTGRTSYENMTEIYETAHLMADHFVPGEKNLLLMGPAGSGKTFISNCIAKAVIDQGFSVIYLPSASLFDRLAAETFSQDAGDDVHEMIFDCDLLIIDDLGTEMNNTFVSSQLFHCINERRLRHRSTIISTNLDLNQIRDSYSERVSSRIIDSYEICRFFNSDIRLIKRRTGSK